MENTDMRVAKVQPHWTLQPTEQCIFTFYFNFNGLISGIYDVSVQLGDCSRSNRQRKGGADPLRGAGTAGSCPAGVCGSGRWTRGRVVDGGGGGQHVWPAEQLGHLHLRGQTARSWLLTMNSDPWKMSPERWAASWRYGLFSSWNRCDRLNSLHSQATDSLWCRFTFSPRWSFLW